MLVARAKQPYYPGEDARMSSMDISYGPDNIFTIFRSGGLVPSDRAHVWARPELRPWDAGNTYRANIGGVVSWWPTIVDAFAAVDAWKNSADANRT